MRTSENLGCCCGVKLRCVSKSFWYLPYSSACSFNKRSFQESEDPITAIISVNTCMQLATDAMKQNLSEKNGISDVPENLCLWHSDATPVSIYNTSFLILASNCWWLGALGAFASRAVSGCSHLKQPEGTIRRSKSRNKNIHTQGPSAGVTVWTPKKHTWENWRRAKSNICSKDIAGIFLVNSLSWGNCKADVSRAAYLHWCRRQRLQYAGRQQNCVGRCNRSVVGLEDHKRVGWVSLLSIKQDTLDTDSGTGKQWPPHS